MWGGGTLAEVYDDVAIRLAPVDEAAAREMVDEVKGLAPIRGYRSLPAGDCAALARAVAALSGLARLRSWTVLEAEINSIVVKSDGEGVAAVDGLLVFAPRATPC